jgi:hypothetical protein
MEKLLGVKEDERIKNTLPEDQRDWIRYDVHEADTLEEEENRDAARQRYQHSYWESVPEDGRVSTRESYGNICLLINISLPSQGTHCPWLPRTRQTNSKAIRQS